jgi:hypothetical protein
LFGSAIYNSKSQTIARRFPRQRQDLDRDFFRRITQARDYQLAPKIDPRLCRLLWRESDGLPGLIVRSIRRCELAKNRPTNIAPARADVGVETVVASRLDFSMKKTFIFLNSSFGA